jgi:hypothetical protein
MIFLVTKKMYDIFILMIFWRGDLSNDLPNEIEQLVGTELLFKVDVSVGFNSNFLDSTLILYSKTVGIEKDNVVMVFNNILKFILFDFLEEKNGGCDYNIYLFYSILTYFLL